MARRLGVAPGTLRTWARRYGIEPTGHEAGTQRRYSAADLARLTMMRRLMLEGVSAADAAQCRARAAGGVAPRARAAAAPRAGPGAPPRPPPRRRGPGRAAARRVTRGPRAGPGSHGTRRAGLRSLLASSLKRRGVLVSWQDMVIPVLGGVGDRWRATGRGVEIEHLLTECVEDALREVTRHIGTPRRTPPGAAGRSDSEAHDAAAVRPRLPRWRRARSQVRMFAAGVPLVALRRRRVRVGAGVVFLWAQGAARRLRSGVAVGDPRRAPSTVADVGGPGMAIPATSRTRYGASRTCAGAVQAI